MQNTVVPISSAAAEERQPGEIVRRKLGVADIYPHRPDERDVEITDVYARRSGADAYAIYRAGDVYIQYSDVPDEARDQRKRVLALGEERTDLAALLVGWTPKRREPYDRKAAMALQLALDGGETADALKILEAARDDAHRERAVAGRLQYLTGVGVGCLLLGALLWAVWAVSAFARFPDPEEGDKLMTAGAAGLLGAAFSVVLAVKSRTVALDTNRRGNWLDGSLRLTIGTLSGGLLFLLLASGILQSFRLDGAAFPIHGFNWKTVAVLGFIAGFIERLVPNLLNKAGQQPAGAPTPKSV